MFCTGFNNIPSGAISMGLMSLPISWETTLAYPIIILILYGFLLLYGNRKPHYSSSHSLNDSAEIVFLPGYIWRLVPIGVLSISLLMICIYIGLPSPGVGELILLLMLFLFFFGLALMCGWAALSSSVTVTQSHVEVKYLFHRQTIDFTRIQFAYMANGYLVIDVGESRRKIIPVIFKESELLLQVIKDRAAGVDT